MKAQNAKTAITVVYFGYFARYLYLLIVIPLYGRVLGPAQYGVVLAAMSLFSTVWLFTNFGFSIVGARDVARLSKFEDVVAEFGNQIHGRILTSGVGILIGAAGTYASPVLRTHPLFGVLATCQGLLMSFNLGWYFQGRGEFKLMTIVDASGFLLSLGLILSLVHSPSDAVYVMVALLLSAFTTVVATHALVLRTLPHRLKDITGGMALIRRATPAFLSGALPAMVDGATNYLLSIKHAAREVGQFGTAERLASFVLGLTGPASQVISPFVSNRLGHAEHDAFQMMRRSIYIMTGFGVIATVGTFLIAPYAIPLVMGAKFNESIPLLQFYSFIFPLAGFNAACRYFVLIPLRRDRITATIAIGNACVSIILIISLLGPFGGRGIIAARLTSELLLFIVIATIILRDDEMRPALVFRRARAAKPVPSTINDKAA